MRKLLHNRHGDMNMILTAITLAIVFAIGLIIVFNVLGSVGGDLSTLDTSLETARANGNTTSGTPATNATKDLTDNIETFFTVGPIALVVVVAVGIVSYVVMLRRR